MGLGIEERQEDKGKRRTEISHVQVQHPCGDSDQYIYLKCSNKLISF